MPQELALGRGRTAIAQKAFLRKVLLAIEMTLGAGLEGLTLSEVQAFLPDKESLCAPVCSLQYARLQALFAGSPFMLSAWTCMAQSVTQYRAGKVIDHLERLLKDYEANGGSPPTLAKVAAQLQRRG